MFIRATKMLLMWEGFRRLYLFAMTENMRAILRRWQKQLFTEQVPQGLIRYLEFRIPRPQILRFIDRKNPMRNWEGSRYPIT